MEEQRQGRWRKVRVYLDSYIAVSFWMHLLCLSLTGVILQNKSNRIKKRRLVLAALYCAGLDTAGMVAAVRWEIDGSFAYNLFMAALGLLIGAGIAYGKRRILSGITVLFGVTALLGGILQILPVKNIGLVCLVGTILLPILTGGITGLFRAKQTQNFMYEVRLYREGKEKILSAFMDTGNRLRLPGSRMPVVLVDRTYLTEWINEAETAMPQKLIFLPYKGVGGKGLLHGVRLHCRIQTENGTVCFGEVAAVAAEHSLFQGCEYQMILQPEVLTMECVENTQKGEKYVI